MSSQEAFSTIPVTILSGFWVQENHAAQPPDCAQGT
jgi:hypothetical protein